MKEETDWKEKFMKMLKFAKRVRSAQKAYFKNRTDSSLKKSKQLEADFDRTIEYYLSEQTKMF